MQNRRWMLTAASGFLAMLPLAPEATAQAQPAEGSKRVSNMTRKPRILMVTTSAKTMGASDEPTGVWLEELTTPYYAFLDAGAEVTVASIAGGGVPIDPRSTGPNQMREASVGRYLKDEAFKAAVAATPGFTTLDPARYDAVFLPGGHGAMYDYPGSEALARLIERFDRDGKIVSAVCHGPAGLVSARQANGSPFVSGRRVAAFTDSEERAVRLDKAVPFLLEARLRELGARHEGGPDFKPFAVRDGHLVTGQNPASAAPAAALVMEALREQRVD